MGLFGREGGDKISVIAQIRTKSGHEAEVRSALAELVGPSEKEPGCLKYSVLEDKHYPGSFFTYEGVGERGGAGYPSADQQSRA